MNSVKNIFAIWKADIPSLSQVVAIILFILNIIFPGIGTILSSFLGGGFRPWQLLVGFLQLILTILLIGWIWSIYWGFLMFEKSR